MGDASLPHHDRLGDYAVIGVLGQEALTQPVHEYALDPLDRRLERGEAVYPGNARDPRAHGLASADAPTVIRADVERRAGEIFGGVAGDHIAIVGEPAGRQDHAAPGAERLSLAVDGGEHSLNRAVGALHEPLRISSEQLRGPLPRRFE